MCSRFLTRAAVLALLVSCVGNPASAAKNEKQENSDGEAPPATVTETVPTNADGCPALSYGSRYYSTDLQWEDKCVRFVDLHILEGGASTSKPLPVVDSKAWSSMQMPAGIYFMESIPGIGLHMIKCRVPDNMVKTDEGVSCEWNDTYGYRNFRMRMDENSVTVEGFDPESGEPVDNWFLSLITAREKGNDLPFSVIIPNRVSAMIGNTEYHLDIPEGTVALNREDTPPVFNIYPSNGTIRLTFDQQ